MFSNFNAIVQFIGTLVGYDGYSGVAIMSLLESAGIPAPAEIFIPHASYIAKVGPMDIYYVILSAVLGSVIGSIVSFFLSEKILHPILVKFFKYIHLHEKADRISKLFSKHGFVIVFFSRFIPILRSYISIPAGLSKMNKVAFGLATFLGSLIWVSILSFIGYNYGYSSKLTYSDLKELSLYAGVFIITLAISYIAYTALNIKIHRNHPQLYQ